MTRKKQPELIRGHAAHRRTEGWLARKEDGDANDDKSDGSLELQKQRNGEIQHKKLSLFFNRAAEQFCPSSDRREVAAVTRTACSHRL